MVAVPQRDKSGFVDFYSGWKGRANCVIKIDEGVFIGGTKGRKFPRYTTQFNSRHDKSWPVHFSTVRYLPVPSVWNNTSPSKNIYTYLSRFFRSFTVDIIFTDFYDVHKICFTVNMSLLWNVRDTTCIFTTGIKCMYMSQKSFCIVRSRKSVYGNYL